MSETSESLAWGGKGPVRLAIVGCGAMTELGHLPALRGTDAIVPTVLIDTDLGRARSVASRFGVPHASDRLADAAIHAEAACAVVPHHVHETVACELIEDGLHVLIEKPLANTLAQCDAIITAAQRKQVVVAVGMVRRFARSTRLLKTIVEGRRFGAVRSFRLVSGTGGVWPARSPFLLDARVAGGGVMMSNGVHDLDLLAALFGWPQEFRFRADADFGKGRMESDVLLNVTMAEGVTGEVELSRTRDLGAGLWIEFEHASVEAPLFGDRITVRFPGSEALALDASIDDRASGGAHDFNAMLTDQLVDFAGAVRGIHPPMVDAADGRRAVETIMRFYDRVEPLDMPWRSPVFVPEAA